MQQVMKQMEMKALSALFIVHEIHSYPGSHRLFCPPLSLAGGLLPRPPASLEHQSQAAVLAAAAAAAAGLPIQVSYMLGRT